MPIQIPKACWQVWISQSQPKFIKSIFLKNTKQREHWTIEPSFPIKLSRQWIISSALQIFIHLIRSNKGKVKGDKLTNKGSNISFKQIAVEW